MFYRQKIILAILDEMGGSVSAKCMQKYLFLFSREQTSEKAFDFVPYKYGCFSFQANQDFVTLSKKGYINIKEEKGKTIYNIYGDHRYIEMLNLFDAMTVRTIKKDYSKYSEEELIAYTYRHWPFTAINSVIKEELLNAEELRAVETYKERYKKVEPVLMTIGYEGMTLEEYLRQLICNDIHVLCDVRKNAYSMKYGFSKAILSKACNGVGIKYIHIPELGIESEDRQSLNEQADYDKLFDKYERTTLKENWNYLLELRETINENKRVCLTCFERDPRQCHRTRIANALMILLQAEYKYRPIIK